MSRSTPRAPLTPEPFALACPMCGTQPISQARRLSIVRGHLFTATTGTTSLIGCHRCVARAGRRILLSNALLGWWAIPWGLLTPFTLIQNAFQLLRSGPGPIDATLRMSGLDPDDWHVDERGFTRREWDLLRIGAFALRRFADRSQLSDVVRISVTWLVDLSDARITESEAHALLRDAPQHGATPHAATVEFRDGLLWAIASLVPQDHPQDFLRPLREVAAWLVCSPEAVQAVLEWLAEQWMIVPVAETELLQAYTMLGVTASTPTEEVHKVYKRLLLRMHPDRAVLNGMSVEDATRQTQRVIDAYQLVVRASR
ncbi:MAG: DnaJ domain-containing protein [Acidimicrobiia bacterium]